MNYIIGLLLLLISIVAGLNLPDLDYRVSFLVHRSIVTHSFFFPLLLFWVVPKKEKPAIHFLSMGFSLSFVAHLCFDLFPKAWTGFALISIPLYGRISPLLSWLWIAGSVVLCLYLALLLVKNLWDVAIIVGSAIISFGFCATTESVFWPALMALRIDCAIRDTIVKKVRILEFFLVGLERAEQRSALAQDVNLGWRPGLPIVL